MDPIAGAIMAGIGGAASIITGISDSRKAKRAEAEADRLMRNRPQYARPGEVNVATGRAMARAGDRRMPGADAARQQSQLMAANAAAAAARGGDPQAAAIGAMAQEQATLRNLAGQEAAYELQQEQILQQQLMESAEYTDMEWQMNEYAPYVDQLTAQLNKARDYRQAGRKNVGQGINAVSNVGLGLLASESSGSGTSTQVDYAGLAEFMQKYGG